MLDKNYTSYLDTIEKTIANGKYKPTWESLRDYPIPQWYRDAKFGIFIHWGVYCVPAFANEWYPHSMYNKDSREYKHHIEKHGAHKDFGYADFIPQFKAEEFDAAEWVDLFKKSGAKYIMPVAEHHDGFQMYDSALSDWNSAKMGPMHDVLGEIKTEAEKEGLVICASSHFAEHVWFFAGCRDFDSGIQDIKYQEPYGYAIKKDDLEKPEHIADFKDHLDMWLVRSCEIVDKYQPKVMWFDWCIQDPPFREYIKKFAAYYYNRALEWGAEVSINYKYDAYALSTAVFDIERGQLADIRPRFWQTDTAIAKNSWGYTDNNDFKDPVDIVCDIIDIVSKNGCMLLNIGPKSDGTFTDEDTNVLLNIGKWLDVNGESIYGTTYWHMYGEGPTEVKEGAFTDVHRSKFTSEDIRFTYSAPYLYANVLSFPEDGIVKIKSLSRGKFTGFIKKAELLGYDADVSFEVTDEALIIKASGNVKSDYPVCVKITID
jgi:Alpha-L-fucosidase